MPPLKGDDEKLFLETKMARLFFVWYCALIDSGWILMVNGQRKNGVISILAITLLLVVLFSYLCQIAKNSHIWLPGPEWSLFWLFRSLDNHHTNHHDYDDDDDQTGEEKAGRLHRDGGDETSKSICLAPYPPSPKNIPRLQFHNNNHHHKVLESRAGKLKPC